MLKLHASADFSIQKGKINPWLHCAGFSPEFHSRGLRNNDSALKALNLKATRTHDWALVNQAQRVIDTHFIFPLMHLDPADPTNYYFKPTDSLLSLTRNLGMDILYRLGTSIEHTGPAGHFNINIPEDYDKYAEVMAGIVRHYTKGWADGFKWDMKYWEIWNEPDGIQNCWAGNGEPADVLRDKFIKLFVTILKRLKSEFPKIKVGGPGLFSANSNYFTALLTACKEAGVAPDFISWHHYPSSPNPSVLIESPKVMRKLCDDLGFKKTKLMITEWHYLITWDGLHGDPRFFTPSAMKRALDGETGHNGIDSATFNIFVISKWLEGTPLDQAYYYGCGHEGAWGYMIGGGILSKTYYSLKMIGEIVANCERLVASESYNDKVSTLAAWSKDKKTAYFLVNEYRGVEQILNVEIKGIEKIKHIEAYALDNTRDFIPISVKMKKNRISLFKDGPNSAAFLLKLEI